MFKKAIKRLIKSIIKITAVFVPVKNYIIFENVPDMSDNTFSVFYEMLSRNLHEKYKFIWLVSDQTKHFPQYPNTLFLDTLSIKNRIKFIRYSMQSKCNISCNEFLISQSKKQTSFFLTHGTAIKSVRSYYTLPCDIDYVIVASEGSKQMMSYEMNFDINKCVALGFPRNDILQTANLNLSEYFNGNYSKFIVWYPTFRQHKNSSHLTNSTYALPIIHDVGKAMQLNETVKRHNILLVIKPHFAQDVSYIVNNNLSNIRIIDDRFFADNGISSYEFVGSCDSLITDYSSIYYDYLLCNKPIALVWEDIEEYKKNPGFAVDPDFYLDSAYKIYSVDDFEHYIVQIANNIDEYKEGRSKINAWANYSDTPDNSKRVVDFIIEKAKL